MAARDFLGRLGEKVPTGFGRDDRESAKTARVEAPLGGTRAEALQRLQVGLTCLFAMVLMIGVASAIGGQADVAEEAAVPDAAPTTEPTASQPQRDPLADAGVVPDIPAEPELGDIEAEVAEPVVTDGSVKVPDTAPSKLEEPIDRE